MGQRIRINFNTISKDGRCATLDFTLRNIKDKDLYLENIQPDDLLDQVMLGNDHVKTHHHQYDDDPVIEQS
jgi:hypothetical protein